MKKKISSLLLVLILCLGLCPAVLAAEPEPAFAYVEASHNYVEVSTLTSVDGKEYPLFIYPAGTTFAFGEQSMGVNNWLFFVWKFSTLEAGANFYDPDFQTTPNSDPQANNEVFKPEPNVVYLLEETNTMDSFLDTYIMVRDSASAEKPSDGGEEVPEETAASPFTDVAADAYYAQPVAWAVEKGITAGKTETTFVPNETCTTAHILTFLWRASGSPEPTIENPFTNVKEEDYFYKAALWAYEKELVSGSEFESSAPCTRGQTMLYLYLLAGSPAAEPTEFTDVAADSVYNHAISWAVEQGITTGKTETTFVPDEICTRGHIVTFLYRAENPPAGEAETTPAT